MGLKPVRSKILFRFCHFWFFFGFVVANFQERLVMISYVLNKNRYMYRHCNLIKRGVKSKNLTEAKKPTLGGDLRN